MVGPSRRQMEQAAADSPLQQIVTDLELNHSVQRGAALLKKLLKLEIIKGYQCSMAGRLIIIEFFKALNYSNAK